MSTPESPKAEPISLEDLIALNEEIAALVRAGIPLEVGLGYSRDTPRNLRAITERLRLEMERGSSLPDALRGCGAELPPSYLALVEAGIKSNRLSDALVSAAAFARTLLEMQRSLRTSLVYPTLVLCVAYGFFLVMLSDLVPRMIIMLTEAHRTPDSLVHGLQFLSQTIVYWGPAIPAIAVAVAIWAGLIPGGSQRPAVMLDRLRFVPWLRRIVNDVQSSSFCHLLALLVERNVPLPEALEVSGSASADPLLERECRQIAAELRRGQPLTQALQSSRRLPAFTRWMLTAGQTQGALPSVMATLGDVYRLRARSRIELFRMSAPLLLTLLLGGGAVAAYAFLVFVPMRNLLIDLTHSG
jgi:type II secretory pathway component PulF